MRVNVVVNGITMQNCVTYDEVKEEISDIFSCYRTVGMTASVVSVETGKIVSIYYLDKDFRMGCVAIN